MGEIVVKIFEWALGVAFAAYVVMMVSAGIVVIKNGTDEDFREFINH